MLMPKRVKYRKPHSHPRIKGPAKRGLAAGGGTNQIDTILLTCRSVNLTSIKSDANTVLAEALADELRSRTNQFVAEGTGIAGDIAGGDVTNLTFTFQLMVKLAKPVNLSQ